MYLDNACADLLRNFSRLKTERSSCKSLVSKINMYTSNIWKIKTAQVLELKSGQNSKTLNNSFMTDYTANEQVRASLLRRLDLLTSRKESADGNMSLTYVLALRVRIRVKTPASLWRLIRGHSKGALTALCQAEIPRRLRLWLELWCHFLYITPNTMLENEGKEEM